MLVGVTFVNFLPINPAPGSPVAAMVDPSAGSEVCEAKRRELGLDQPI